MRRTVARLHAVLVGVATCAVAAAPALAAPGDTVRVTQVPGEFTAGGEAGEVTVVASRSRGDCGKLRWSLVVRLDSGRADRVRVDRIEEDGLFPVNVQTAGNATRITDQRLDPGTLCRDRTVTAQYEIAVADDAVEAATRVTLAAEAFSAGGQLLDRTTVTRDLRPAGGSPSAGPSADAAAGADADAGAAAPADSGAPGAGGGLDASRTSARAGSVRVGPIGLAVGAVMVLLGLGLLVKVRRRSRWIRPVTPPVSRRATQQRATQQRSAQQRSAQQRTTQRRGKTRPTLTLPPLRR